MNKEELVQKLKTFTILYVEDEDNIRTEMEKILSLLCNKVLAYSNADDAFSGFKQNNPDIVLSDISLNGKSGIDLTKKIRQYNKIIPVILLSAHTDKEYLLEAAKLKLVAYLTKPIGFEELHNTLLDGVKEVIDKKTNSLENTSNLFFLSKEISFDIQHKMLLVNNKQKKLSAYESKLLEYFIKHKERTLSPEEIKNNIWDDPYDATDTALKSLLYKLRTKVGKETIKNLSGIGYYLNLKNQNSN